MLVRLAGVSLMLGVCATVQIAPAQTGSGELEVVRLRPNFHLIAGAGANIAVDTGPDGTVLVDAGSAAASDRVLAAIRRLTDQPIRYIINTCADAGRRMADRDHRDRGSDLPGEPFDPE